MSSCTDHCDLRTAPLNDRVGAHSCSVEQQAGLSKHRLTFEPKPADGVLEGADQPENKIVVGGEALAAPMTPSEPHTTASVNVPPISIPMTYSRYAGLLMKQRTAQPMPAHRLEMGGSTEVPIQLDPESGLVRNPQPTVFRHRLVKE